MQLTNQITTSFIKAFDGISLNQMSQEYQQEWVSLCRTLYPDFDDWLVKCSPLNTKMLVFTGPDGATLGQAIYKIRVGEKIKLCNFYIKKSARGAGVGKVFLQSLLEILRHQFPGWEIYATVKQATRCKYFYGKQGFTIITGENTDIVVHQLQAPHTYPDYGVLPFTYDYFNDFATLDYKRNCFTAWRYFTRISNVSRFLGNRVLLYVSSPLQGIIGEATISPQPITNARIVASPDDRLNSLNSVYLTDFTVYPNILSLDNLLGAKALNSHPMRLSHIREDKFKFIQSLAVNV